MSKQLLIALVVLALVSLACSIPTNLPAARTAGPDVTDQISVAATDGDAHLTLAFGGGKLTLAPGSAELVEGTATYNLPELKPIIKTEGRDVSISVGNYKTNGMSLSNKFKNEWDLKLGAAPMDLTISAGGYEGTLNLGGLALKNLTITDGASQLTTDFSSPNKEKLAVLTVKTGASTVTLKNLGNANFDAFNFEGGAGKYKLDFGGTFQRAGSVTVQAGVSSLELVIPSGIAAAVKVSGGISNLQVPSGWIKNGETYTQEGSGPGLSMTIEMGAGSVKITQ